jgi:hypothetical protein
MVAAGLVSVTVLAVLQVSLSILRPPVGGEVKGVAQAGPSDSGLGSSPQARSPSPGSSTDDARSAPPSDAPPASDLPSAPATATPAQAQPQTKPAISLGDAVVRTWKGPYGETRLQVIVPLRSDDSRWLRLPRAQSTYRVVDGAGREIASGVFTAALPAAVGPGEAAYLVDTVSVAFENPTGSPVVDVDVSATATDRPISALSVSDLRATIGTGGGLRVTGRVHNVGTLASAWVMAGAVALGPDGSPLGAVYDPTDIGRLEAGQTLPFDTEYPGAPPLSAGLAHDLVGMAFEAGT